MVWPSRPSPRARRRGRGLLGSLAIVVLLGFGAGSAAASAPTPENETRLDSTVRFLQEAQNLDGGFGGVPGGQSDPGISAWVALALAAAGVNPQDQAKQGGIDVYTYLSLHAPELSATTDFERALLVVDAAGGSPNGFGGVELARSILGRKLPDGSFAHEAAGGSGINDTVFAVLALSPIKDGVTTEAVELAAEWLEAEQLEDGGWASNCPKGLAGCNPRAEVDMTAAALEALNAAGRRETPAQLKAFGFLRSIQHSDGGFSETPSEVESNVASTAWTAQAIWSADQDPETWINPTANPLGYMASLQQTDGSIRFKASEDSIPVWMTAYVAPAFAGQPLPPPVVPRADPSDPSPVAASAVSTPASGGAEAGHGGESSGRGGGVIAGGGGNGAPLFSRPQPQSRGGTRGGARTLYSPPKRAVAARSSRQPPGTPAETTEGGRDQRSSGGGASQPNRGALAAASAGGESGSSQVNGVLIGAGNSSHGAAPPAAAGLHGADAGGTGTPWLAIAIGGAIALLAAAGSLLERKRPQMVL